MSSPRYQDADFLEQRYWGDGLQLTEIAEECDVSKTTIIRSMDEHSIERRSKGDYRSDEKYRDPDWLYTKYHEEGLSQREMAEECEVVRSTIHQWMVRHDIELRSKSESLSGERHPFWNTSCEFSESHRESMSECRMGEKHHFHGGTHSEETKRLISQSLAGREPTEPQLENLRQYRQYVSENGMPQSHREAIRQSHLSGDHPLSTGGFSCYSSSLWDQRREAALVRAGYTCEDPDCELGPAEIGTNPHVHHIVPARYFDDIRLAHDLANLLVLCPTHHPQMDHWIRLSEQDHDSVQRDSVRDASVG